MPRTARITAPGYPHHITQRGNYKQDTFIESIDYRRYLQWLNKYSLEYALKILAYCLMPNHIHCVAVPEQRFSLSKTFAVCHTVYSQYVNKKNTLCGHLWQGRFHSCILDEAHLYAAIRYVENNPVRANLVEKAEDWIWSSARYHLKKEKSIVALADIDEFIDVGDWQSYLEDCDEKTTAIIRANTLSGRPAGNSAFISKLESSLEKQFKRSPVGRPKRKKG